MSGRRFCDLSAALAVTAMALALALPTTSASAVQSPSGTVSGVQSLSAIACPTSTHCVAVGSDSSLDGKGVVVNASNGAGTVGPGKVTETSFEDVACAVPTTCVAVGVGGTARVEVANGATTFISRINRPADDLAPLGSIACPSPSECFAVGFLGTESRSEALLARTTSTGVVQSTVEEAGTSGIGAIACTMATQCLLAVADRSNPEKIQLLTNGHFGASRALPAKTYIQELACYKDVACYALAGKSSGSPKTNLLYELSPTTGAIKAEHSIGGGFSADGIACPTADQCILTGFVSAKPVIVIATRGVPGAPRHIGGESVSGVGCADATACFAVGQDTTVGLVEKV